MLATLPWLLKQRHRCGPGTLNSGRGFPLIHNPYVTLPRACLGSGLVLLKTQDGIFFNCVSAKMATSSLISTGCQREVNTVELLFVLCLLGTAYHTLKNIWQKE